MKITLIACLLLIDSVQVFGYGIKTHIDLTQIALEKSEIYRGDTLTQLGLPNVSIVSEKEYLNNRSVNAFKNSKSKIRTIYELLQDGVAFEDTLLSQEDSEPDLGLLRVLNHFYNPQDDGAALSPILGVSGHPSPDWILQDSTESLNYENNFSYLDAKAI